MFLFRPEVQKLNSSKYVYLREISEPRDNSLCLVVQQAVENPSGVVRLSPLPGINKLLEGSVPIGSTEACESSKLLWKSYIAYSVTEECVGSCGSYDDEVYEGAVIRVYKRSYFLDHPPRDTGGHTDAIGHYKIICLNHLIDVASYAPPVVECFGLSAPSQEQRIH